MAISLGSVVVFVALEAVVTFRGHLKTVPWLALLSGSCMSITLINLIDKLTEYKSRRSQRSPRYEPTQ